MARRFPHKKTKRVSNGLRSTSIRTFLAGLLLVFQPNQASGLDATFHFILTGEEESKATVIIRSKTLQVAEGHLGAPDLSITADSRTWLRFLAKETNLVWAFLCRKVRLNGSPRSMLAFDRWFPA